jgi:hypothetical protein
MKKVTLKLVDILNLEAEIFGMRNTETNETILLGLKNETLPLQTKLHINRLAKIVGEEKKLIEEVKADIIKTHGVKKENGDWELNPFLDEEKTQENPAFKTYVEEFESMLFNQTKEIEVYAFEPKDLGSEPTKYDYPVFFNQIIG